MANTTTPSAKTTALTTTLPVAGQQVDLSTTTFAIIEQQSPSAEETYENRLQAAVEHARRLTQMHGYQGTDVAIAWETVEELSTAARGRFLPTVPSCRASFERYCAENPHALEARIYDC